MEAEEQEKEHCEDNQAHKVVEETIHANFQSSLWSYAKKY